MLRLQIHKLNLVAAEIGQEAYIKHHVPRIRRASGRVIEAPPPWIPYGERSTPLGPPPETPVPLCAHASCREPIFYEQRAWHHRDGERNHEAMPEEIYGKRDPLSKAEQNRRYRAKKILDTPTDP